jgi:hypothetical protein
MYDTRVNIYMYVTDENGGRSYDPKASYICVHKNGWVFNSKKVARAGLGIEPRIF